MNAGLSLAVQGRVDAADFELFCTMREAGVKMITFGLESGNQDVLDFYRKETTVGLNAAAIRLADRAGLYTGGIFILGAPFETKEHFRNTYRFAASLPLDITTFWVLDYAYGSPLWEDGFRKGTHRADEFIVPAGKERGTQQFTTVEIMSVCEAYFFRFYRRPSYWFRQIGKFIGIHDVYLLLVLLAGIRFLIVRKLTIQVRNVRNGWVRAVRYLRSDKGMRGGENTVDPGVAACRENRVASVWRLLP
jgi:radical SAM superfamily enzyme YgiQ (UPF0313 family)